MTYYVGSKVRLSAAFKNISDVNTDPSTVEVRILKPGGNVDRYTYAAGDVVRDGAGQYHIDIDITSDGTWWHRWEGKGTLIAAAEDSFNVAERKV